MASDKRSFFVEFSSEQEVWGPNALAAGDIPFHSNGVSYVAIQNTGDVPVTVGVAKSAIEDYEGIVLNPGDGVEAGGSMVLDTKTNSASINYVRAKPFSGTARLSFLVI